MDDTSRLERLRQALIIAERVGNANLVNSLKVAIKRINQTHL